MTRAIYGGTPADFAIGQGAAADILNDLGAVVGSGTAALLPTTGQTFNVYRNDRSTIADDLLNHLGEEITQITSVASFDERARFMWFSGEDDDVPETYWASPATGDLAGVVFYALLPHAEALVGYVDGAVGRASIDALNDVNTAGKADGDMLAWVLADGAWKPQTAGAPSRTPVVSVYDGAWETRADIVGDAPFVWWIVPLAFAGAPDPADGEDIDVIDRIVAP